MKVFCFLTHKVKVKYTKEITIATIVGDTGLDWKMLRSLRYWNFKLHSNSQQNTGYYFFTIKKKYKINQ